MNALYVLMGLLPWILVFAGTVYLIHLWKQPGPEQLHRAEVDELREEMSLMRDFIRDAMHRIARLEEERAGRPELPGRAVPTTPSIDADAPTPED